MIGAGINGAAIAREAALGGIKVLLVERGDIGGGTSSASSRLIHGGLRYLEHVELGLVRESLRERERLLTLAPHLVEPLELCIPVYRGARRKRWQIGVGLALYDLLSAGKSLPSRRLFGREELLAHMPGLNGDGLVGGASYYDAQVRYPERLVARECARRRRARRRARDLCARHARSSSSAAARPASTGNRRTVAAARVRR